MFDNAKIELNEKNADALGNISVFPAEVKNLFEIGEEALTPAQTILNSVSKNAEEMFTEDVFFNEGLNAEDIFLCDAKAKVHNMRQMSMMRVSANTSAAASIDVSSAVPVEVDTVYNLSGFSAGKQLLLKVTTDGIAKLSSVIQFVEATVVGTIIFTVDENSVPTLVANSINRIQNFDIVSCLPKVGPYYVLYTVYSGGGQVALTLQTSTTYSVNEPNDSPSQAVLRHEEAYVFDTYDNVFDTDYVRLQITNPERMLMAVAFVNKHLTGTVNFGIYHKTDENGNAVDRWIMNKQISLPAFFMDWNNTDAKGEFYIYTQYIDGDNLNQPYVLYFTPVSKLPYPTYVSTGEKGVTGLQSGYVGGYHWVIGAFEVIADFRQGLEKNVDGLYPCFVTDLRLLGKDKNGKWDEAHNSSSSGFVITTPDGITKIGSLLPYPYGQDGYFQGTKYQHSYDVNRAYLRYLRYDGKRYYWEENRDQVSAFNPFLNVTK